MKHTGLNRQRLYGIDKLSALYLEFTKYSVFGSSQAERVMPTCGGSFFGSKATERFLDKSRFEVMQSVFCHDELQIKGIMPVAELFYFRAENQKRYQQYPRRYFDLVKMHLCEMNKQSTTHDNAWCFFPMYHREEGHLQFFEISAFVLWLKKPRTENFASVKLVARIYK